MEHFITFLVEIAKAMGDSNKFSIGRLMVLLAAILIAISIWRLPDHHYGFEITQGDMR